VSDCATLLRHSTADSFPAAVPDIDISQHGNKQNGESLTDVVIIIIVTAAEHQQQRMYLGNYEGKSENKVPYFIANK
jgi:hypothetical protein